MSVLNYPLSDAQIELLKLFNTNLSDKDLIELKYLLSGFYADKAINAADNIGDKRGLNDDDMENGLIKIIRGVAPTNIVTTDLNPLKG